MNPNYLLVLIRKNLSDSFLAYAQYLAGRKTAPPGSVVFIFVHHGGRIDTDDNGEAISTRIASPSSVITAFS